MMSSILLTLLAVSCSVHHSSQMMHQVATGNGASQVQQTTEVPCGTLSNLRIDARQVSGTREVNRIQMCTVSANQIPSTIDELITADEMNGAAFASQLKPCQGILYNKDMCLTQQQFNILRNEGLHQNTHRRRVKRKAVRALTSRWLRNVVPYVIDNVFSATEVERIRNAMNDWERGTCITFRPATQQDFDRINIMSGNGCYSNLGRTGGQQDLSLGGGQCRTSKVIRHELGHALGLIHEHQRFDRDDYVTILLENVQQEFRNQFTQFSTASVDITSTRYDYFSIMHYGKNFFSRDGSSITVRTIDQRYQDVIGRVENLSFTDFKAVNIYYQCAAACPSTITCLGAGYVGPNCQCVCPDDVFSCSSGGPAPPPPPGPPPPAPPPPQCPPAPPRCLICLARAWQQPALIVSDTPVQRTWPNDIGGSNVTPNDINHSANSGSSNNQNLRTRLLRSIFRRNPALIQRLALSILNEESQGSRSAGDRVRLILSAFGF